MSSATRVRLLIAIEPAVYQEVFTRALTQLRPAADVIGVDPGAMDEEIARHRPHVVVCGRPAPARESGLSWVMLYPGGGTTAVLTSASGDTTIPNVELTDLLAILDQAEKALRLQEPVFALLPVALPGRRIPGSRPRPVTT